MSTEVVQLVYTAVTCEQIIFSQCYISDAVSQSPSHTAFVWPRVGLYARFWVCLCPTRSSM